jgi:putative two-component system response regulator
MTTADSQPPVNEGSPETTWCQSLTQPGNDHGAAPVPPRPAASPAALSATARVMIVDDEPVNIKVVQKHLKMAGYQHFITSTDPRPVLEMISKESPDVLLLDIMMPEVSGLDILRRMRDDANVTFVPTIILTASDNEETKLKALDLGATDFLGKPVNVAELVVRVRNALLVKSHYDHIKNYTYELERQVRLRTTELAASRLELIHCLGRAAEYRDNETGRHVVRVGRYAEIIARQLGLDEPFVELVAHAAPLHDMGKVGIPDGILLKPDRLTQDEFEIMQKHCAFGKRTFEPMSYDEWRTFKSHTILGEMIMDVESSPLITMAAKIALTHHEKWDGSGYPLGLAGEDIPLGGRITAAADVFDALSTKRPYKPAFPLDRCFTIMEEGRGTHFDPKVVDALLACHEAIIQVRMEFADVD